MRIIVEATAYSLCPNFDWMAFDDAIFPDGPVGHGRSPLRALLQLLEIVDGDAEAEAAVGAKIAERFAIGAA